MKGGKREARAATTAAAALCGSALVVPHFPAVEHALNVVMWVAFAAVLLGFAAVVARDLWL